MNHLASSESDVEIDLEMGLNIDAEDLNKDSANLCGSVQDAVKVTAEQSRGEGERTVDQVETKVVKEKRKKSSNKKHPKPPRPPRSPSLDAVDQKLIREISEVAILKRARVERMKALKKTKAAKSSSSSNSSMFAMVFTVIFCLVFIFHGMSCRVKPANLQASPESSGVTTGSLISVEYMGNPSSSFPGIGPDSPISDPVSALDSPENLPRIQR